MKTYLVIGLILTAVVVGVIVSAVLLRSSEMDASYWTSRGLSQKEADGEARFYQARQKLIDAGMTQHEAHVYLRSKINALFAPLPFDNPNWRDHADHQLRLLNDPTFPANLLPY